MRTFLVFGLTVGVSAGLLLSTVRAQSMLNPSGIVPPPVVKVPTASQLAHLPLAFERISEGSRDHYIARGQGYTIGLEDAKATIAVVSGDTRKAVSIEFEGARPGKALPGPELPGKINVIRGKDPRRWRLGSSAYERVSWTGVYPGIDVVYYGNQQQLEFDLAVKPGADPGTIRMKMRGADKLSLDASGALKLGAAADGLRIGMPTIYQYINGARKNVPGHFTILAGDEVAFRVDPWDKTRPLVIDPTITYSTMFGGGLSSDSAQGVALDSQGNILITGYTYSADFPVLNAWQNRLNGTGSNSNAFVTKINPTGTALIYSTFLGGSSYDYAEGIAVDAAGAAWITGSTQSSDFPVLNAAQPAYAGNTDAFVAKLNSSGTLQFSTFLGGSSYDYGQAIAVDASGNGYVTGSAGGPFPTTAGVLFSSAPLGSVGFVTKYNTSGTILYSTLLGGISGDGDYGNAIAADQSGNAYVTGGAYSTTFVGAPSGGAQTTNHGNGDAFVAKLNSTGSALLYFTFLGGTGYDEGSAIKVDNTSGVAFIGGQTTSAGLATVGAAQTSLGLAGASNGFIAKLNASGSAFNYVTYLGGTRLDYLYGLALDGSDNVYVTGYTDSANFPTVSAIQAAMPGNAISLVHSTNSSASWSTADGNIPGAVAAISVNPSGSSEVVLTESGIFRSVNSGATWTLQYGIGFYGYSSSIARSPVAPSTIYTVACCSSIYKSTDDGVSWNYISGPPFGQTIKLLADPLTTNTIYELDYSSPYISKSTDGGITWNGAVSGLPGGVQVESIAATTDGVLYAGTDGSGVYKSSNQGASWIAANNGLPTGSYVYSLSASGTTVYFADGTIYKTTNGGASWTQTASYVGSTNIAVSPQNPSVLYAYTNANTVQESSNGGSSWNAAGIGFPGVSGYSNPTLVVDPSNSASVFAIIGVNTAAFVAKLNSTGSAFTWSTYLGGTQSSYGYGIATDGNGNTFVTGFAGGGGFPVTSTALPSGQYGSFLTKISDNTASCSLTLSPASTLAQQYGDTLNFSVLAPSGCTWTASTNQSWAPVTYGTSGSGTGVIVVQPTGNTASATRSATLTVGGTPGATITQPSENCNFATDKTSYPVAAAGGTVSVILTASSGCPWTVTNNYRSAISITSGASGTGNGTISLTVAPNLNDSVQTFYLSVGFSSITISQAMPTNTISGQVTFGGVGLSGVTINVTGTQTTSTTASASGNYSISLGTGGTYTLSASLSGYSFSSPITFSNLNSNQTANFTAFAVNGSGLDFYPVTPCRVADTRNGTGFTGQFGPPSMGQGAIRTFNILSSPCAAGIPSTVAAYSLNFTVVPPAGGPAANLTTWPATLPTMPNVSTLNYYGSVVAGAAVVPAGTSGAINLYVSYPTDVLFDINGYFAPPLSSGLEFYPVTPCRITDTRTGAGFTGQFGPPAMAGGLAGIRTFNILSSPCASAIPSTVAAYSLNFTAIPPTGGPAANLTTWPASQAGMPNVSTLNYYGSVVANAAIVPSAATGAINLFASYPTNVLFDINGYFAPPLASGLHFYPLTPCRIADTRNGTGFSGQFGPPLMGQGATRTFNVLSSPCAAGIPASVAAYSLNFTVVPPAGGPAANLTTWPAGLATGMPNVSTLNYYGNVVAGAATVPAGTNGAINVFVSYPTDVLFDINGYFAP